MTKRTKDPGTLMSPAEPSSGVTRRIKVAPKETIEIVLAKKADLQDIASDVNWDFRLGWNAAPLPLITVQSAVILASIIGIVSTTDAYTERLYSMTAWFLGYDLLVRTLYSHGGKYMQETNWGSNGDECARAINFTGMFHQFIVFNVIFLACYFLAANDFARFWSGKAGGATEKLGYQFFWSLIMYEAKDVVPGRGLDLVFLLHHLATILGGYISMTTPYGFGIVMSVAVSAQFGSGFYNLFCLQQSRSTFLLYMFMMSLSNAYCAWAAWQYYHVEGVESWRRNLYVTLTSFLVPLRIAGTILEFSKWNYPSSAK